MALDHRFDVGLIKILAGFLREIGFLFADLLEAFRERLIRSGIFTTTRKTRGDEIAAACGQLVGRVRDRAGRTPAFAGWPQPVLTA